MSGAAGGTRIPRAAVELTVKDFVSKILSKIPGFKSAKISGSYNQPVKQNFGDIDLVVSIEGDKPKKEIKKMIVDYLEGLSDKELPYLNAEKHKGKKAINHGEIITNLYPISGMPGEFVQIDNIIAVSESEGDFKKVVLDYPAELQGLILGLVKTPLLEEDPEQVFKRMGVENVPLLGPNQEYEFHLDTSGLSLKIVTLDENYRQLDSNIIWESTSFEDVKKLLKDFNLDGTFDQFIEKIKKFKNPRSKNRVKGFFKTSIKVGPAEQGTPKGDGKQQALDTVAALEEKYGLFAIDLIKPLLLEQEGTIAIFPGKFKPPHKDHLARIQAAAKMADQVRVIIGPNPVAKTGEAAISAQEALAIFDLYKKKNLVPDNVTFEISDIPSPVLKAYQEFEANPDQKYIAVFGKDDAARFKGLAEMSNVTINNFPEANIGDGSATDLRKVIAKNDIAAIKEFLPFGVSPAEYLDALNMPVKEPMSEGKSIKKLRVFDFDDTLAHIKALIRITHQDGNKEELTPAEYAVYNPQPGDKFNFSDFNKVIRQAHPIENNVQDLIRSYNDPTEKTTILTARMLGYPVKKYLRDQFGIEPYVVGLGSADPMDKARWIEQQIHKGYNDIEFRDDSKKNVDAVATLQDKYSDVRLTSMLAESYKGKRTSDGAPGTLKAKISKLYGGDVTIAKAKKLKSRENATPHDKRQANWFINFHSKNEGLNEVGEANLQPYKWTETKKIDEDSAYSVKFETESETEYEVIITLRTYGNYKLEDRPPFALIIEFSAKTKDSNLQSSDIVVNKGELFKVMATITAIVKYYVEQARRRVDILVYTPAKRSQEQALGSQRDKLYKAFISKAIPGVEFKQQADTIITVLPTNSVQERKGKSAPYGSEYKPLEEGLIPMIASLTKYMYNQGLPIDPAPEIEFIEDEDNAKNPLGRTAYYDPNNKAIALYTTGRHPKDILRSFAHEMIHHCQNMEGRLGNVHTTNINEDDYLKELEREAYERGNMCFRSWENSLRGDNGVRYIKGFAPGDHNDEPIMAEGKQVGPLYHFTSTAGLKNILESNRVNASQEYYLGNDLYYISFTRNKNFHNKGSKFGVKTDYRITLDGDKLSDRYKITPHAYKPGYDYTENWEYDWLVDQPENVVRDFFAATGEYDEQEERISFKGPEGGIDNIKNYILAVDKVEDLQKNNLPRLNEGRYDSLTSKLSKIAFDAFKSIHDRGDKKGSFSFTVGPYAEYEEEQPDIQSDDFEFDFQGVVEITKRVYKVDGGANEGFDKEGEEIQPLIVLKFRIPQDPDWQKVSFDIKDVVRHELEHLTQDGLNEKPGKYMEDDKFFRDMIDKKELSKDNYFRLEKEIDAMLQGMYFKAKKSRQPFTDVLNNYLDMQQISPEDKENILDLWRNRAKSLSLPKF